LEKEEGQEGQEKQPGEGERKGCILDGRVGVTPSMGVLPVLQGQEVEQNERANMMKRLDKTRGKNQGKRERLDKPEGTDRWKGKVSSPRCWFVGSGG